MYSLYLQYSIIISIQIVLICTEKWDIDLEYLPGREFICSLIQINFLSYSKRDLK